MTTETKWVRTCQECGHKQVSQRPAKGIELTNAYFNAKCSECGSKALDYGREILRLR